MPSRQTRVGIAATGAGCLAAFLLRAAFLAGRGETYDLESWRIVTSVLRHGKDLYLETRRYNYSPLWAAVLYVLDGLSRILRISLPLLLSLFFLVVDLGIAALVREIALRKGKTGIQAFFLALLFFANPVSVIVSSRLFTFDNLSIAFLLLALVSLSRSGGRSAAAAGWLSLSLLAKHVTWFHPLLFARRRREPRLSWPAALSPYALSRETTTIVFVLAALAGVLFARVELDRACLLLFLVLLIFTPGICAYYFVWPVALGALFPSAGYLVYTIVITAFFLKSPDGAGLASPAWLVGLLVRRGLLAPLGNSRNSPRRHGRRRQDQCEPDRLNHDAPVEGAAVIPELHRTRVGSLTLSRRRLSGARLPLQAGHGS